MMRKALGLIALTITSAALLAIPAMARDRDDYRGGYGYTQPYSNTYNYGYADPYATPYANGYSYGYAEPYAYGYNYSTNNRREHEWRERQRRERRAREHAEHEWREHHRDWR